MVFIRRFSLPGPDIGCFTKPCFNRSCRNSSTELFFALVSFLGLDYVRIKRASCELNRSIRDGFPGGVRTQDPKYCSLSVLTDQVRPDHFRWHDLRKDIPVLYLSKSFKNRIIQWYR